jgi:hypothetical protein
VNGFARQPARRLAAFLSALPILAAGLLATTDFAAAQPPESQISTEPLGMSGWRSDPTVIATDALGMSGWRSAGLEVTTEAVGMTGWRTKPLIVAADQLGMTGWTRGAVVVTTQAVGLTGWRSAAADVMTQALGMTGWSAAPIAVATPPMGMTGWLRSSNAVPPPMIVCLGGQLKNVAARESAPSYECSCPAGRVARAMASNYKNTFQCIPDAVATPASSSKPKLVCTGGSVRNDACVCGAGYAPVKTGATSYRCNRVVALPPPVIAPKPPAPTRVIIPQPQVACAGGTVRSGRCYCPGGSLLQYGVCVPAVNVPLRRSTPQRMR